RDETPAEPASDVVEHGLGIRNRRIAGEPGRLEARVDELIYERLERYAVLQTDGNRERESVHKARERGAFFGHLDEDLSGLTSVVVHPDGDVAFVASNRKFVGNRLAFIRQLAAPHAWNGGKELALWFRWSGGRRLGDRRLRRLGSGFLVGSLACSGGGER